MLVGSSSSFFELPSPSDSGFVNTLTSSDDMLRCPIALARAPPAAAVGCCTGRGCVRTTERARRRDATRGVIAPSSRRVRPTARTECRNTRHVCRLCRVCYTGLRLVGSLPLVASEKIGRDNNSRTPTGDCQKDLAQFFRSQRLQRNTSVRVNHHLAHLRPDVHVVMILAPIFRIRFSKLGMKLGPCTVARKRDPAR
eukprot:COSAG02_NODE_15086_length_1205_cov_1.378843_2_plen_196_part_01